MDRYIELVFAGIDPGADHARLAHLRGPFLVMRTYSSFNHPGPMKNRPRSCYDGSPRGCGWARSDDRRSGPGGHPGRTVPHGTVPSYRIALIQGWVERSDTRPLSPRRKVRWVLQALNPSYALS